MVGSIHTYPCYHTVHDCVDLVLKMTSHVCTSYLFFGSVHM